MSKGSRQRPAQVPQDTLAERWERTFQQEREPESPEQAAVRERLERGDRVELYGW